MELTNDILAQGEAFVEHHGVKGMKWGVRKNNKGDGRARFQASGPTVDASLSASTKTAGKRVAGLMDSRYGFKITAIKAISPTNDPDEWNRGTYGYVQLTPGQRGGVIFARQGNLKPALVASEKVGWMREGTGNETGLFTHEAAHALFHAEESTRMGLFRAKTVGGNIEARDKALKAATDQAQRDGIKGHEFTSKISGYAGTSNTRQEAEAEMFGQYHWSPNPPPFVKVWGETLHQEMGLDPTPFREVVKNG